MTPTSVNGRRSREVCVGIDIGTTSVKAVAADANGNVVARARVPHALRVPAPDRMEHDAAQAWRRGPVKALKALELDGDPLAVSVSAMVPSLTAVDEKGRPIAPGLLYGDVRGRVAGERRSQPGDSGEAVEFLRWLAREHPGAAGYWQAQAVANHALGGVAAIDGSTAFSAYPLYGLDGWDEAILKEAGVEESQLPRIENNGQPIGKVGDAILGASAIDAMGEQVVAAADDPGDVLVICGTTLIVWAVLDDERHVDNLWTIPSFTPGKLLIGGPSNAGGLFLNWAKNLLGKAKGDATPARVPVFSPYVRGERVPLHDPDRRAAISGLDLTHDATAVQRAAYEASGFATRHLIELGGTSARRIVATGGGTKDPRWMQALADCTGLPVDVVAVAEGGALGAAWFARMAAGLETSMSDAARWARTSHRVEPDRAWLAAVDERYRVYRDLAGA